MQSCPPTLYPLYPLSSGIPASSLSWDKPRDFRPQPPSCNAASYIHGPVSHTFPTEFSMSVNISFVQESEAVCTVGCSDFDFFCTFWGITTHPWHPKGPRIWKLAKKKFQLHPWPAEIFGKNRKMRFLGLVSKFNFRSPFDRSLPFFKHVLFMESLIHI